MRRIETAPPSLDLPLKGLSTRTERRGLLPRNDSRRAGLQRHVRWLDGLHARRGRRRTGGPSLHSAAEAGSKRALSCSSPRQARPPPLHSSETVQASSQRGGKDDGSALGRAGPRGTLSDGRASEDENRRAYSVGGWSNEVRAQQGQRGSQAAGPLQWWSNGAS